MKRILICMLILLMVLCLPAQAQGVTMYKLAYDKSMVEDWYESAYPFPETLLYLNQSEDQVLVMLLNKEEYASPEVYVVNTVEDIKEYSEVTVSSEPGDWKAPWGEEGKTAGFTSEMIEDGEEYISKYRLYAADYDENLLVVEMAFSPARSDEWINQFTGTFLNDRFSIQKEIGDEQKIGYVKAMHVSADGSLVVTVDYANLVSGEDEYDYTVEGDGEPAQQVVVSADAQVNIPDVESFGESVLITDPISAVAAFNACYAQNPNLLFELVIKDGLVIWMDYCAMV